ncbi:MAG: FAD-binding oxidoreductase [Planctomycetaceae bacterium]
MTKIEPGSTFQPLTQAELAEFVTANSTDARRRLLCVGGGTAICEASRESPIEVRLDQLNRVIDYPARDMTITVEAGIRMAELTRILNAENQRLPIDVPQAEQATLGGIIATNWSGPRRFGCGTMRDYVIGISAIDATGRRFSAGGRVVKNVAGYDLCKLLVGSRGELAIISQVTLKLRPRVETSALVGLTFDSTRQVEAVLARLMNSATRPMAIEVLNRQASLKSLVATSSHRVLLCVGYEGAEREVRWQVESLIAEAQPFEPRSAASLFGTDAEPVWAELTDFVLSGESSATRSPLTFKAAVLPSRTMEVLQLATEADISAKAHAGNGIVHGHLPATVTAAAQAEAILKPLSELANSCNGHLAVLRCPTECPIAPQVGGNMAGREWSERIQRQLDPHGLLRR